MSGLFRLLKQKWYTPAPETASFAGRTVLITGATTGLGLEAAKKIACLEPEALIITARSKERGDKAKELIEQHAKSRMPADKLPPIHLLLLNMSQFTAVIEFANEVTTQFPTINTIILNAGCAARNWTESSDGWEEQIQVNALSTTLLALLLLKKLSANTGEDSPITPQIEIVTSGLARIQTAASLAEYMKAEDPLQKLNDKSAALDGESISGAQKQYARSKVIMEINMRRIAMLSLITGGPKSPKVIVNSACPGLCYTDLSREMGTTLPLKVFMAVFFTAFGRSAEQGSNTLVSSLTRGVEGHGKMWKDDQFQDAGEFLGSAEGRDFSDRVWRSTCKVLRQCDPDGMKGVLEG